MERVKKQTRKTDRIRYANQAKKLNWDEVAFDDYSADECEQHFIKLMNTIRSYRILQEICEDLETELAKTPFKRPMTSYNLFIKQMKKRNPSVSQLSE